MEWSRSETGSEKRGCWLLVVGGSRIERNSTSRIDVGCAERCKMGVMERKGKGKGRAGKRRGKEGKEGRGKNVVEL